MPHQSDQGMTVVKMTDTLCLRGVSPVTQLGENKGCVWPNNAEVDSLESISVSKIGAKKRGPMGSLRPPAS